MVQIRLTMIAAFAMTIASLTFGVGAITRQDKGVPTATNAVPSRTMTIHVVDRDGRPLIAARVFKNHVYKLPGNDRSLIENQDLRTDAGDSVTIPLSGTTVDLRVWASRTGFIPLHAMWAKQFQPDGDLIPEEFTFKLDPGTVIGGIVEDEGGQPIAGAQVEVRDQTAYRFHAIRPEELSPRPVRSYSLAEGDEAIITDAQGRWKLENVPADRDLVFDPADTADGLFGPPPEPREIELQVSHPAYSSYGFRGRSHQPRQEITLKSLRDQTAKIVLKKK